MYKRQIANLVAGTDGGWFGAVNTGGQWEVLGGPEDGTAFWQGAGGASGGHTVNGQFAHWRDAGEPSGDGNHAYVGSTGWNDFPDFNPGVGYVIEIGGRPQDIFSTNEDRVTAISASQLLANDFDPDGDTFTITGVSTTGISTGVSATSARGATVTLSNGTIFYDPTQSTELQALTAGQSIVDLSLIHI